MAPCPGIGRGSAALGVHPTIPATSIAAIRKTVIPLRERTFCKLSILFIFHLYTLVFVWFMGRFDRLPDHSIQSRLLKPSPRQEHPGST